MDPSASPQIPVSSVGATTTIPDIEPILPDDTSQTNTVIFYVLVLIVVSTIVAYYAGFNVFAFLGVSIDELGERVFPIWDRAISTWANILKNVGVEVEEEARREVAKGAGDVAETAEIVKQTAEGAKQAREEKRKRKEMKQTGGGGEEDEDEDEDEDETEIVPADADMMASSSTKKTRSSTAPTTGATDVNEDVKQSNKAEQQRVVSSGDSEGDSGDFSLGLIVNKKYEKEKKSEVKPDDAPSKPGPSKGGWCYIGSYEGIRSCSRVGDSSKCMSGDIFPTQDVCVNPRLRA